MILPSRLFSIATLLFAIGTGMVGQSSSVAEVSLVTETGQHKLLRNGQPYFIKGVGGSASPEALVAAGGNSFRTWGDEKLGEELAFAQKLGLTVTAGIWLGQVRQGFDWTNADGLTRQMEHVRVTVEKHKDAPALLIWALGNEMEDPSGHNAAVWLAINQLAHMVKQIDPHHPTMTVIAEIGGDKVKNIHRFCPEIDIIGINSYGGAASLGDRYRKAGGIKPYIVTEYGPPGIWEVPKGRNGAYPEPTSTEKAEIYRRSYQSAVAGEPGLCLGSYAFLWGQKQEATATWFSMFLRDGTRLGAVDTMQELWSGKAPANRCPVISALKMEGPDELDPNGAVHLSLDASDPEKDPLKVTWTLQRDAEEFGSGGDKEQAPPTFPEAILKSDLQGADLRLPDEGGLFRCFATVRDDHGGAAVANVALRVKGAVHIAPGRKVPLPLAVYEDAESTVTYTPAGWMGDATAIQLDPACTEKPHSGKTCLRCDFTATKGWGGVVWQNPEQDWGDRAGGFDLSGAQRLAFWARGEKGGEIVTFQFGIIPREKKFFDTAKGQLEKVALTPDWKEYVIDVRGKDLTRIKTGFVWTLASGGQPVTFYLDDIRWEGSAEK